MLDGLIAQRRLLYRLPAYTTPQLATTADSEYDSVSFVQFSSRLAAVEGDSVVVVVQVQICALWTYERV